MQAKAANRDTTQIEHTITLYMSCYELMLDRFIEIAATGKVELLTITGNPSKEMLQERWQLIYTEYTELINNGGSSEIAKAIKDINVWRMKFERIKLYVDILLEHSVPWLIVELRRMGYNYAFNVADIESYMQDLHAVYDQSKLLLVQIENRKKDLEGLQKPNKDDKELTRSYFNKLLIGLCEHYKYQIIPSHITVAQFTQMVKYVNDYNKRLSKDFKNQQEKATWHRNR